MAVETKYLIEDSDTNEWLCASFEPVSHGMKTVTYPDIQMTNNSSSWGILKFDTKEQAKLHLIGITEYGGRSERNLIITEHQFG